MNNHRILAIVSALLIFSSVRALASEDGYGPIRSVLLHEQTGNCQDASPAPSACGDCSQGCSPSACCPTWEVGVDYMMMQRFGGKSQTLLSDGRTDREVLSTNDFNFGFEGGPRVTAVRRGCRGYDLEFIYFGIDGWSSTRDVPANPNNRYVVHTQSGDYHTTGGPFQVDYATKLYNGELNVKWNPTCRIAVLAGFRWDELTERLSGFNLVTAVDGQLRTTNDLVGFQIGSEISLWETCRGGIEAYAKLGLFNNHATGSYTQTTLLYHAATDHAAFVGDVGLRAHYDFNCHWTGRLGYELIWLDGVATAPAQVAGFNPNAPAVLTNGTAWYHGFTAGLEYKF